MKKGLFAVLLLAFATVSVGCSSMVLKQDIPVSTNPMGAKVYVDGQLAGQTPGTVSLERNRDHILTFVKENYRQEDVVIRKVYQQDRVMMKAIGSGINSGLFFKDTQMGISSGLSSISSQEHSGEAYILVPSSVTMNLVVLGGAATDVLSGASSMGQISEGRRSNPSETAPVDQRAVATDLMKIGIAAGASQMKPAEKTWKSSSSTSSTYRSPDGSTEITKKSSTRTSAGVSVNPAGLATVLDVLFR